MRAYVPRGSRQDATFRGAALRHFDFVWVVGLSSLYIYARGPCANYDQLNLDGGAGVDAQAYIVKFLSCRIASILVFVRGSAVYALCCKVVFDKVYRIYLIVRVYLIVVSFPLDFQRIDVKLSLNIHRFYK